MKNNKCKVLLCSPLDVSSGCGIARWANHIKTYYKQQKRSIIDVDFHSMDRTFFVDDTTNIVTRVFYGIKDYFKIIKSICFRIKNNNYDIVHLVSSASISLIKDLYLLQKLNKCKLKSVLHFHFGRIPELYKSNNWEWRLIAKAIKLATVVVVIDKTSYDTLINVGFKNIRFLPNPLTPIITDIIAFNDKIERDNNTILFVGHVFRTKGIYELVETCSNIPNIKLKIVGKYLENIKKELVDIANKSKGKIYIDFAGNMAYENVIREMLKCTLFVLPTYTEGFPNVILESMACGCTIVTTPVGAIPEMLNISGKQPCGICVRVKDSEMLKKTINFLLSNPNLMKEYGQRAKTRVYDEYSINKVWNKMIKIWNEI